MTSLQQAPAKGQQVPPPKMIDGVSEQQIDEAVKAHVRKAKVATPRPMPGQDHCRIIMEVMLKSIARRTNALRAALDQDVADDDENVVDAINLVSIAEREVSRMRSTSYDNSYAFGIDVLDLASLFVAIRRAYGDTNTLARRLMESLDLELVGQLELVQTADRGVTA